MKKLGSPGNNLEARAEQAIRRFAAIDAGRASYAAATSPVASPSYHAVESASFDVAPDGKEPTLFLRLGTDEVAARILHAGVGGISESDVTLAEGFNAAIIGFSVRANKEAAAAAKRNGIEIRYYNIIYDLVDDVKKAMSGLLAPTLRETMLGNAQILEVFNISKVGKVAGCRVTDGTVERGANVRLIRDNVVVHEGKLSTLKRFKDEVKEVASGQECGMAFENYGDMRAGDVIECYRVETIQRSL